MNDVVQPESVDPLVLQDDVRFSNLVVDIVQGMDTLYHVMYISTGGWREGWSRAEVQEAPHPSSRFFPLLSNQNTAPF